MSQRYRNVFLRDCNGAEIGGLFQNGSVSHKNLYAMVEMITVLNAEIRLYGWDGKRREEVLPNDQIAAVGDYEILKPDGSPLQVVLTDERTLRRSLSGSSTRRASIFRDEVRARDGGCVVTGIRVINDYWSGVIAAHIFPRAWEDIWMQNNYRRWVTDLPPHQDSGPSIDSPRNGLLLESGIHQQFDNWNFSINPDDGYKITVFGPDMFRVDGKILQPSCRNPDDTRRVSDELLRWHFRQAILFNVKGAGEPHWEWDFPRGTDMIGEIMKGPDGPERMELELATRLGQPLP